MDVSSVASSSSAIAAVNSGSAVAVSVLSSSESALSTQVNILFNSLGIGQNVDAKA